MNRLLNNGDVQVRRWVIEGLGISHRKTAHQILERHLSKEDDTVLEDKIKMILAK